VKWFASLALEARMRVVSSP